MECWVGCACSNKLQRRKGPLQIAFHIKKVKRPTFARPLLRQCRAIRQATDAAGLIVTCHPARRIRLRAIAHKYAANLKEANTATAAVEVCPQVTQQTTP